MVERSPDTFYSEAPWFRTKGGLRLKKKFTAWCLKQYPQFLEGRPEFMPRNIILEVMCDFFEANHKNLRLGRTDKLEVGRIWKEAAQHLQKENDRNANAQLLANGKS